MKVLKSTKQGWSFYQKAGGLELYFLKLELNFTFFYLFLAE
jgi:hypothetical protein